MNIGLIVTALVFPMQTQAHIAENMGLKEPFDPLPILKDALPIADQETQRLALDMENAACEDLMALSPEVRDAFLVTHMLIQRPGTLSRLVGPDCQYAGPAEEIALISDSLLTTSDGEESLYYLADAHAIVVTNKAYNAVAYGMFYHGEDPVGFFIENRAEAQELAALSRLFLEAIPALEPPAEVRRETAVQIAISSRASSFSSSTYSQTSVTPQPGGGVAPQRTTSSAAQQLSQSDAMVATDTSVLTQAGETMPNIEPLGPQTETKTELTSSDSRVLLIALVGLVVLAIIGTLLLLRRRSKTKVPTPA